MWLISTNSSTSNVGLRSTSEAFHFIPDEELATASGVSQSHRFECSNDANHFYDRISSDTPALHQREESHSVGMRKTKKGFIYFRKIKPSDRDEIQRLHEQWFPVSYKSDFFDRLCQEQNMPGTAEPLYCCIACFRELSESDYINARHRAFEGCLKNKGFSFFTRRKQHYLSNSYVCIEPFGECLLWESDCHDCNTITLKERNENQRMMQYSLAPTVSTTSENSTKMCLSKLDYGSSKKSIRENIERQRIIRFYENGFRFDDLTYSQNDTECAQISCESNHSVKNNTPCSLNDKERIVGCLVGSFIPSSHPSIKHASEDDKEGQDETATLLVPNPTCHPRMFYIMTLGAVCEFRRAGLGSILVNRVVEMIRTIPECGALFLHVIVFNEGAMKLYERLGFSRVKEIEDYYTINGVNYNCYLYARYFHGNHGHRSSFYDMFYSVWALIWNSFSPSLISSGNEQL